MKKQHFLGIMVVIGFTFFTSPSFAHNGEYHATVAEATTHDSVDTGIFSFLKNIFTIPKTALTANVIKSTDVTAVKASTNEQRVRDQEILKLESKLRTIDASIQRQTTILESPLLQKVVSKNKVNANTIGKAIEEKNALITKLAEKSPKDAIKFIEKNKLVGKKQIVGTPVTILKKKNVVVDIGHFDYDKKDQADYFGSYIDDRVIKTVFSEQFRGLGGQYKIAEFTGYQFGNNILITQMSGFEQVVQIEEIQQRSTSDIDYKVLVLLVDYLDSDPAQQLTDAQTAHDILFNGDLHNFFYEQSYGKMNMVGDVYGWYTLQSNAEGTYCNPIKTANNGNAGLFDNQELMNYMVTDNVQVTSYDHVMIIANCKNVTGGGFANTFQYQTSNAYLSGWQEIGFNSLNQSVPLAVVKTPNGSASLHTMSHELGHMLYGGFLGFSYNHAKSVDCGDQIITGTDCSTIEYGNYFDAMGSWQAFSNHFRVGFKEMLGWIEQEKILTITESSEEEDFYTLTPLERIGGFNTELGDYKMVKLQPSYMDYAPYILEYRRAIGYDSNLTGQLGYNTDGIFIYKSSHYGTEIQQAERAVLLDMHPNDIIWDEDVKHVTLNVGRTYFDENLGITIEMINANPQHAFFRVVYAECNPVNPLISWAGDLQILQPQAGELKRYWTRVNYVNNNPATCGTPLTFSINVTTDSFINTIIPISENSLGLGYTNDFGFYIIVPLGTPVGTYNVYATITNQNLGLSTTQTIPITVN